MLQKFPSDKKKKETVQKMPSFFFASSNSSQLYFSFVILIRAESHGLSL